LREIQEYNIDPMSTTTIPIAFKGKIGVEKIIVDIIIISTCFTFPAMVSVRGDVSLFVMRLVMLRELTKTILFLNQ